MNGSLNGSSVEVPTKSRIRRIKEGLTNRTRVCGQERGEGVEQLDALKEVTGERFVNVAEID